MTLSGSVTADVSTRSTPLKLLGAALRRKKVAIVKIPVYVIELYGTDVADFNRTEDGALASLKSEQTVAVQLHFLRDVDAGQVQSAFQDSLAANNVDQTQTDIVNFLSAVVKCGPAQNGKTYTIVGEKLADGSEVVSYQGTQGDPVSIAGPAGFVSEVMSIWLGNPADAELGSAKSDLLRDRAISF